MNKKMNSKGKSSGIALIIILIVALLLAYLAVTQMGSLGFGGKSGQTQQANAVEQTQNMVDAINARIRQQAGVVDELQRP